MRAITRFTGTAAFAVAALLAGCDSSDAPRIVQARGAPEESSAFALVQRSPDAGSAFASPGPQRLSGAGNNVQLDPTRDELYAIRGRKVVVRAASEMLDPSAPPLRSFALSALLTTPRTLWFDTANDVLYVGGDAIGGGGAIVAYSFAHTIKGMAMIPARTMFVEGGVAFFTVDPLRRRLYVADTGGAVRAYAGIDSASGPLTPAMTYPLLGSGLAIDATHDRLYVADEFSGLMLVDHASAPAAAVSATLSIADARQVAFDAKHDRAIVSASADLYVLDHASTLGATSALPAPATAALADTLLGGVVLR